MPVLLDSHTLYWWSSDSSRLSATAARVVARADELLVASISWFELARLAQKGKLLVPMPVRSWLESLSEGVRTIAATPAIAATAAELPATFPGDPADRLIYATAIELGCVLVTKDERMRAHRHSRRVTVW